MLPVVTSKQCIVNSLALSSSQASRDDRSQLFEDSPAIADNTMSFYAAFASREDEMPRAQSSHISATKTRRLE